MAAERSWRRLDGAGCLNTDLPLGFPNGCLLKERRAEDIKVLFTIRCTEWLGSKHL
jgi:hypothetical protein